MKTIAVICLFFTISMNSLALGEGVYTVIVKKQEEKNSSRWSLADWLGTKKRISLMDQWLALNSTSSWFEFVFDFGQGKLDENISRLETGNQIEFERYGASLYMKFIGLEFNKYNYSQLIGKNDYRVNLLLLGSSVQSTHLRFFYGRRNFKQLDFSSYAQNFYGSSLSLYLASFFGTELTYMNFKNAKSIDGSYSVEGERVEYGAFVELSLFRIYVNKFIEKSIYRGSINQLRKDDGIVLGAKIFL